MVPAMTRPTAAQRRILEKAAQHRVGRVCTGDPRTTRAMLDRGWIDVDGYYYGPLYKITDAGRAAIATPAKKDGAP